MISMKMILRIGENIMKMIYLWTNKMAFLLNNPLNNLSIITIRNYDDC